MHQFHIRDQVIIDDYMKRMSSDNWDKSTDRDDHEFLHTERKIWAEMYPSEAVGEEEELGEEDRTNDGIPVKLIENIEDTDNDLCNFFDNGDSEQTVQKKGKGEQNDDDGLTAALV